MIEPPDLELPFTNDSERSLVLAQLLETSTAIERWRELTADPARIPPEKREVLMHGLQPGDGPEMKLRRWANIYDKELRVVIETRNRVVHGMRLSDSELRGASWLARRLLGLIEPQNAA